MKNIEILQHIADQEPDLVKHVTNKLNSYKHITKFHVGFSGGADSVVLLTIAAFLKHAGHIAELQAIHINHGISKDANKWEDSCRSIASNLNIPYKSARVSLENKYASLENNARVARYNEFAKLVNHNEAILLAHHLDDQLETILMRMFKGTGATGICGIKDATTINNINVIRPLLEIPKDQILAFAKRQNLSYINDPSNKDCNIDRNYIRHKIIPNIKAKWPDAAQNVARSIKHIEEQEQHVSEYCAAIMLKISSGNKISITALQQHTEVEQRLILRSWIMKHNIYSPSSQTLHQIFNELINAKIDRNPIINIDKIQLRRYKKHIYLLASSQNRTADIADIFWPGSEQTLYIPHLNKTLQRHGSHKLSNADFTVKFRKGGEKIARCSNRPAKTLKNFMYEANIPPWERDSIPLIYYQDELICITGFFLAEKYQSKEDFNISYL